MKIKILCMQKLLFCVLRRSKAWFCRKMSTIKPEGKIRRNDAVMFLGKGRVRIGIGNAFGLYPSPNYFNGSAYIEARYEDALVQIGNNNYFNNKLSICAEHGCIIIGDDCLFGENVSIINSDFYPIRISERHKTTQKSKDVIIGNNVFISNNVSICKGVHVGNNAVIANGAVVFDDVKENTIVRGNPAVVYKEKIYE